MKRSQLEHILRACKGTTDQTDFIVVGSQSILGRFPDAPRLLRQSMEADVYPKTRPELAPLLTGNLGELSLFHQTHGYWVDGVSPTTATLPAGWEVRLVKVLRCGVASIYYSFAGTWRRRVRGRHGQTIANKRNWILVSYHGPRQCAAQGRRKDAWRAEGSGRCFEIGREIPEGIWVVLGRRVGG